LNIKILSDIHTDYDNDIGISFIKSIPNENIDLLILAGDITTGGHLEKYEDLIKCISERFKETIIVLGNHDAYKKTIKQSHEVMDNIVSKLPNVYHLNNSIKEINGQRFLGSTLWFPEKPKMPGLSSWVDVRHIKNAIPDIYNENKKAIKFFENNLQQNDIVITHHVPSDFCVHPQYKGDDYNCYFVGDATHLIFHHKPKFWFYGHTHLAYDCIVEETRCIVNPRSYPQERSYCGFNPDLLIEV